jgi:hypothetical protein
LRLCDELEKNCCGDFAVGTVVGVAIEYAVSKNEPVETFYLSLKSPLYAYTHPI